MPTIRPHAQQQRSHPPPRTANLTPTQLSRPNRVATHSRQPPAPSRATRPSHAAAPAPSRPPTRTGTSAPPPPPRQPVAGVRHVHPMSRARGVPRPTAAGRMRAAPRPPHRERHSPGVPVRRVPSQPQARRGPPPPAPASRLVAGKLRCFKSNVFKLLKLSNIL